MRTGTHHQVTGGVLHRRQTVQSRVPAGQFQRAVLPPREPRQHRQRRTLEQHHVPGAVAVDDDLTVAFRRLVRGGHRIVAVLRVLGHHRVERRRTALDVERRTPTVAPRRPRLRHAVVTAPRARNEVPQRDTGGETRPPRTTRLETHRELVPGGTPHARHPEHAPGRNLRPEEDPPQLQLPVHDPVTGDPAPYDLHPELQLALKEHRHDPGVLVDIAVRRVRRGTRTAPGDAPPTEQPLAEHPRRHVPGALDPLPPPHQPRGVEPRLETGPVVAVTVLAGMLGGLRTEPRTNGSDQETPLLPVPQRQALHRHVTAVHVHETDVRRAAEVEPLALPLRAAQQGVHGELLVQPVRPLVQPHTTVTQERVVDVATETPPYGQRTAPTLEREHVQQLLEHALPHQQPLHPRVGGQFVENGWVGRLHELPGPLHESVPELLIRVGQHLQMQHEVRLEAGEIVLALVVVIRAGTVRTEETTHRPDRGDPVPQVPQLGMTLGDRRRGGALTTTPEVHEIGDDVDLARPEVSEHVDPGVLIEDPLGKLDVVVVPERPPEHLVPDGAVVDQRLETRDVRTLALLGHGRLVQRRLPLPGTVHHLHVPGHEVRTRRPQRAHHQLVRVLRDDVVPVHEREELPLRMHRAQTHVPRVAGAVGLLADVVEPRVTTAEVESDGGGAVGGPVVDEDDLQVVQGLPGDGLEALSEVDLDVLERDYHAQEWPFGTQPSFPSRLPRRSGNDHR